MIQSFQGRVPNIDDNVWIAKTALVIGAIAIKRNSSVWFHSVIRSEKAQIFIGEQTNIQDNCVLHTDLDYDLTIGDRVTIGHQCIVHGCTIGNDTLIGMGSIIMNGARVGNHCIIGAGAIVIEHMEIPDYSIAVGSPAKVIKPISEEQRLFIQQNAEHYQTLSQRYQQEEKQWKNM